MTYPEWPVALPYHPWRDMWDYVPARESLQTEMEGGDTRQRRRPGDDVGTMQWGRTFTAAEMDLWDGFLTDTSGGVARFIMPVPTNGATYQLRVVQIVGGAGGVSSSAVGIETQVSFSLRVFPADMVPLPEITVFDYWILGTGIAGWTVEVEIDGVTYTAPVTSGGSFILDASSFLTVGSHSVRIRHAGGVFTAAETISFTAGAFDGLSASLYALHGVCRLLAAWKIPVLRARRTDNAESDFYGINVAPWLIDSTGVSIAEWSAGTSAYLTTFYDQTGQARHALQATGSAQWRLVNAGVLDVGPNGRPAPVLSGAQYLDIQNSAAFSRDRAALTFAAISRATGASTQVILSNCIASTAASSRTAFGYSNSTSPFMQTRTTDAGTFATQAGAAVTSGAWSRLIGRGRYAAGAVDISVNGTIATNAPMTPAQNTPNSDAAANVRVGAAAFGGAYLTGGISTVVLAQSAEDMAALDAALVSVMP